MNKTDTHQTGRRCRIPGIYPSLWNCGCCRLCHLRPIFFFFYPSRGKTLSLFAEGERERESERVRWECSRLEQKRGETLKVFVWVDGKHLGLLFFPSAQPADLQKGVGWLNCRCGQWYPRPLSRLSEACCVARLWSEAALCNVRWCIQLKTWLKVYWLTYISNCFLLTQQVRLMICFTWR